MDITDKKIEAYALKNALEHNGKAISASVLNSLFIEGLKKEEIKDTLPKINEIVSQINSFSEAEQKEKYDIIKKELKKREVRQEGELPELPNAIMGKVVTRLAPEPSKYNHIGHALSFLINYLYSKKYNGKCVLRFEDTNPEKVSQEYVDAMKTDVLEYLEIEPDETRFVSDDMELLYGYAEEMIKKGHAYTCFCEQEKLRDLRQEGRECPHRLLPASKNMENWKEMLKGKFKEGEVSLRMRGNMQSQNYVMRDPVIFRIISSPHYKYKNKYKVWPMYDFYNPIEDNLCKVTHIMRSNEFEPRIELQNYIKDLFRLPRQEIIQYGRFNIIGSKQQGREIRQLISTGEYIGWNDPRLFTLRALKDRGIVKETYYELLNHLGLSKKSPTIDFNLIAAINRKYIENSPRYFFVPSPTKIKIKGCPELVAKLPLHPSENLGFREYKTSQEFYIPEEDFDLMQNTNYRLMHLLNFKSEKIGIRERDFSFISAEPDNKLGVKFIQWLPANAENMKITIRMPDNTLVKGLGEPELIKLKEETIIQFERFGFCKLHSIDKKKKEAEFWFAHR